MNHDASSANCPLLLRSCVGVLHHSLGMLVSSSYCPMFPDLLPSWNFTNCNLYDSLPLSLSLSIHLSLSLQVLDARDANTPKEMFDAICHHIKYANNGGNLRYLFVFFFCLSPWSFLTKTSLHLNTPKWPSITMNLLFC